LFFHKDVAMTCEKNTLDANEYYKILKPPPKLGKPTNSKNNKLI